jgi:hypothetical protein
MKEIIKRKTKQSLHCRGCDRIIMKGTEDVIVACSSRGRGGYLYLCKECIDKMQSLFQERIREVGTEQGVLDTLEFIKYKGTTNEAD